MLVVEAVELKMHLLQEELVVVVEVEMVVILVL
jgi:hypothetical protein